MDLWKAEDDVRDIVTDLIGQHHPDLALIEEEIAVVFREKASRAGGQVVLGRSKKGSPLLSVLSGTQWKFIIELGADSWLELTTAQKKALLDHHLCACRCEEDETSGNLKYYLAAPDVAFYWDELDRHGDWRPRPEDEERGPSPVEEIFGTSAPAATAAEADAAEADSDD